MFIVWLGLGTINIEHHELWKCLILLPETCVKMSWSLIKMSGFVATNSWKMSWLLILEKFWFCCHDDNWKMSRHLVQNIRFCCHNHSCQCLDVWSETFGFVATNTAGKIWFCLHKHGWKMSPHLTKHVLILLPLTGLKMCWDLIKKIWFCPHKHDWKMSRHLVQKCLDFSPQMSCFVSTNSAENVATSH